MTVLQAFLHLKAGGRLADSFSFTSQTEVIAAWRMAVTADSRTGGFLDLGFVESAVAWDRIVTPVPGRILVTATACRGLPLLASRTDVVCEHLAVVISNGVPHSADERSVTLDAIDRDNPFAVVAHASDALLDVELSRISIPLRAYNIFRNKWLTTVRDVVSLGFDGLNGLRGLGEKSIRGFGQALADHVESGALERRPAFVGDSDRSSGSFSIGSLEAKSLDMIDRDNPFAVIAYASDDLLDVELSRISIPLRAYNVFRNRRLTTVRDVVSLGFDGLSGLKGLGEKSIRDFGRALADYVESRALERRPTFVGDSDRSSGSFLIAGVEANWPQVEVENPAATTTNFRAAVVESLKGLKERDAYVLGCRIGMDGPPMILDEIGASLGITRERARQLETRARATILGRYQWPVDLRIQLDLLLKQRDEPLYLDLIAAEDTRFDGFQDNLRWLGRIIEEFGPGDLHIWELDTRLIASRLPEEKWSDLREAALAALQGQMETGLSVAEVSLILEAISAGMGAPELAGVLNKSIEPLLHFVQEAHQPARLVAIGRGLKPAILSIFEESDRPLHFREVRDRLRERGYDELSQTSLRTAIRGAGMLLFGRSVYGTRAHLALSDETIIDLRTELVEIISDEPDHQWHAAELVEELQRTANAAFDGIDRYTIGAILDGAREVAYLGRQVWTAKDRRPLTTRDRRDVAQLVEAVLVEAGRPLAKKELREAIERARGLNENFLPQPTERVVRLGNGRWGLIDRDCRLTPDQTEHALRALESILFKRGKALHSSEVEEAVAERGVRLPTGTGDELIGRAQIDPRFRLARGGFVALPLWQSLGRMTISEALELTLEEWSGPATTEAVHAKVERLLERSINRWHVTQSLSRAGLVFDYSSGLWERSSEEAEDHELVDEAV
jgi:hypothetical protein